MKHVGTISSGRPTAARDVERDPTRAAPEPADAKGDFLNAIWRAWWDYVDAKKNELSVV